MRVERDLSCYNTVYLVPLADPQIGEPEFDEKALIAHRDWILEHENAYTGLVGDWFSTYVLYNKAVNFWKMALSPKQCRRKALEILTPIADRILWVQYGNHSRRAYNLTGESMLEGLVRDLGLDEDKMLSLGGVLVNLKVGKVKYSAFSLHGWGGARTRGGQVNKVREMAKVIPKADVYLQGHEHSLFVDRGEVFNTDGGKHRSLFVGCGTFCDYTDFQEGIARELPNIGAPRIRFNGERKDVHGSI